MQHGGCPVYPVGHICVEPPKQRGTPDWSSLQHCHLGGMQSQQSSRAFPPHTASPILGPHTAPRGLQPCGFAHTPAGGFAPWIGLHVTPMPPPQQSPFFWHRFPTTRQPLAGAQM